MLSTNEKELLVHAVCHLHMIVSVDGGVKLMCRTCGNKELLHVVDRPQFDKFGEYCGEEIEIYKEEVE